MKIPIITPLVNAIWGDKDDIHDDPMYMPSNIQLPEHSPFTAPEFAEPFYRAAELNMKVESKESLIESIRTSHLNLNCKNAFLAIVETYFDRNILLSDLTGKNVTKHGSSDEQVLIAYWRAKIDVMGVVRSNSGRFDRNSPEFIRVEQLILSQIWYRLKRTKGPDRERIATGKIQMSYETKQSVSQNKGESK